MHIWSNTYISNFKPRVGLGTQSIAFLLNESDFILSCKKTESPKGKGRPPIAIFHQEKKLIDGIMRSLFIDYGKSAFTKYEEGK